ncbi:hypothetical protein HON52_00140 [Candidatus Uhrbacteria bacterium]|jgi:hypothetical protein|nr:hypothetical protein [Candidatus Uhrbacteria bacterium]
MTYLPTMLALLGFSTAHAARNEIPAEPTPITYTVFIGPSYELQGQPTFTKGAATCEALASRFESETNPASIALCGIDATKDGITSALSVTVSALTPHDNLLVVYLGQGWETQGGHYKLLPADFSLESGIAGLEESSIDFERDFKWTLRNASNQGGEVVILMDAVHSVHIELTPSGVEEGEPSGILTIGPTAANFNDGQDAGLLIVSATGGEYTIDDGLFGGIVEDSLAGQADEDGDGKLTFGELKLFVLSESATRTKGQQKGLSEGPWMLMHEVHFMDLPVPSAPKRQRSGLNVASLRKPALYSGIGLSVAGCGVTIVGRVMANGAYADMDAGNYSDRDQYNDLVGTYETGAGLYPVGIATCTTGLVLTATSFILGKGNGDKKVTLTPAVTGTTGANATVGFTARW